MNNQVDMLCEVPNYVKLSLPWPHFPLVFLGFTLLLLHIIPS
jgi:hypothetical protein